MSNASRKLLWETALTETRSTDVEGIGSVREDRFGNKYRWVYNASTIDSVAGGPACYDLTLYSGVNFQKHVLANPADADIIFLAGIFISAIPTLEYGWILTHGKYATANVALASGGSAAANDLLIPSTLVGTTVTGTGKAFSFLAGWTPGAAFTGFTAANAMLEFWNLGSVRLLAAVASGGTTGAAASTTPAQAVVLVRGM